MQQVNYIDDSLTEFEMAEMYLEMDEIECYSDYTEEDIEKDNDNDDNYENKTGDYNCICNLMDCDCHFIETNILRSSNVRIPVIHFETYMFLFKKWKDEFEKKKQ